MTFYIQYYNDCITKNNENRSNIINAKVKVFVYYNY